MLVDVTSMIASVGSSTFGSGTVSTRTSRLPCQVTAFIATFPSGLVSDSNTREDRSETAFGAVNLFLMRLSPRPLETAGIGVLRQGRHSGDADDLLRNRRDSRLGGRDDAVSVLVRLLIGQN